MSVDYQVGQCRVISNQRGYYFEKSCKLFEGLKHINLT